LFALLKKELPENTVAILFTKGHVVKEKQKAYGKGKKA